VDQEASTVAKRKNKLSTSARPLVEIDADEAAAVNGGTQVFGLTTNPNPPVFGIPAKPPTHHHHKPKKPIFGVII
jgi:hypothetical protein